jgi:hypothetical protein
MSNEAWQSYHRRSAALRDVVAHLDTSGATEPEWSDDLAVVFGDRGGLLVALHDVWSRRLAARIELALDVGEDLPAECVESAWFEVAAELAGVRRVLDAHAHDDVLRKHEQHEHRLVAIASGMVGVDAPLEYAARAGALLVANVRAQHVEPVVPTPRLGERLVSALRWRSSAEAALAAAHR